MTFEKDKDKAPGSRSTPAAKAADTAKVEALLTALIERARHRRS